MTSIKGSFSKIKLNKRQQTPNVYNKIKSNNVIKSNLKKAKSLNKIFINYRSCIPKQKLLKIFIILNQIWEMPVVALRLWRWYIEEFLQVLEQMATLMT